MSIELLRAGDLTRPSAIGGTRRSPESRRSKLLVRDLTMQYPTASGESTVLEGIDLAVSEGEFVCLVGPSGCGKTTLLHVIAGLLEPTSGEVSIDGERVLGPDRRRVLVFQEGGVFPWLTVEGNVAFPIQRMPRKARAARVAHYVELVGLTGFEDRYPHALSGGMRQRLEIARALAVNPEVLYLDEPFGALDFITRMTLRSELIRIWSVERKTIVLVTHDIDEAVQLADRVIVMTAAPGRIQRVVHVDVPRPRNLSADRYLRIRDELMLEMGLAHQV